MLYLVKVNDTNRVRLLLSLFLVLNVHLTQERNYFDGRVLRVWSMNVDAFTPLTTSIWMRPSSNSIQLSSCRSNLLYSQTTNDKYKHNLYATVLYVKDRSTSHLRSTNDGNDDNFDNTNSNNNIEATMGLNELHTKLRDAVQVEDYIEAARISDVLLTRMNDSTLLSSDEKKTLRKRMSWRGLGAAPWLIDRLDALQYTFPTTIQINAMEAVNSILAETSNGDRANNINKNSNNENSMNEVSTLSLEERTNQLSNEDMGIVISGTTGSGKTLAYCVPLLSTLSDSLFLRQRLRISDEEAVGDTAGDLVDRINVVTSPRINSSNRVQRNTNVIATGASMGRSGTDVKRPLALVVVPTRELGVQTALLLYQLVGGNIKTSPIQFSTPKANMFKYKGPKGIRIGCVLDEEEAQFGLKLQTDIAITTPQYLSKLLADGDVDPMKLRVIVYDEADLALEETNANDLLQLFDNDNDENREYTRLTFLVGASVTEALGSLAVSSRVLPLGKSYIATATRFAPIQSDMADMIVTTTATNDNNSIESNGKKDATKIVDGTQSASLQDLNLCLYPDLKHERVIVKNETALLVLTRLLRKELQDYEEKIKQQQNSAADVTTGNSNDSDYDDEDNILDRDLGITKLPPTPGISSTIQRPRVVVFFPDEIQAKKAIEPLRDALWGEHRLCVLLPKIGVNPLTIMEQFKNNQTTVMLATANSVRGLDFPALTHVYTLYLPIDDAREYVHLAGRVGRVGQQGRSSGSGGHVVSILQEKDASKMDQLASILGFQFTDIEPPENTIRIRVNDDGELIDDEDDDEMEKIEIEKMRRLLEDTISLLNIDTSSKQPFDEELIDEQTKQLPRNDDNNDPFQ